MANVTDIRRTARGYRFHAVYSYKSGEKNQSLSSYISEPASVLSQTSDGSLSSKIPSVPRLKPEVVLVNWR